MTASSWAVFWVVGGSVSNMSSKVANLVDCIEERESLCLGPQRDRNRFHFTETLARKLCLDEVLEGHAGCVNRLCWNETGDLLASGSDDRQVILWNYPQISSQHTAIPTQHDANIFGVAFLPCHNDRYLITCAMDRTVQLHELDARPSPSPVPCRPVEPVGRRHRHRPQLHTANARTTVYSCHEGRVKDVEVEPGNAHMFWSAGEDGYVRQFDTRCQNQQEFTSPNVLVALKRARERIEVKSLAINHARPHYMALACGDAYIRIMDRRKLSTGSPSQVPGSEPVLRLAPPHLTLNDDRWTHHHATYVHFSHRGDKVVATYHNDHAYCFDVTSAGAQDVVYMQPKVNSVMSDQRSGPSPLELNRLAGQVDLAPCGEGDGVSTGGRSSPQVAAELTDRIRHLSRQLSRRPTSAHLYCQRGVCLRERGWSGDAAFALKDFDQAIVLEPRLAAAHWNRILALRDLGQYQTAMSCLDGYRRAFADVLDPEQSGELSAKLHMSLMERAKKREAEASRRQARQRSTRSRRATSPTSDSEGEKEANGHTATKEEPQEPAWKYYGGTEVAEGSCPSTSEGVGTDGARELSRKRSYDYYQSLWNGLVGGRRLLQRYVGHCNTQTDIKEAVFVGRGDQLVACGSDDGRVFIYSAETGEVLRVLEADEDVANCVQCHPTLPVLATSGIESVVRLWSPLEAPFSPPSSRIITSNQEKMMEGPPSFNALRALADNPEIMDLLLSLYGGRRVPVGEGDPGGREQGDEEEEEDDDEDDEDGPGLAPSSGCRVT